MTMDELIDPQERAVLVPIAHLARLRADLAAWRGQETLVEGQKFILDRIYQTDLPEADFPIRSILVVATPTPWMLRVRFAYRGRTVTALAPAPFDEKAAARRIAQRVERAGGHVLSAARLPRKRLAVSAGLGRYGRNNLCYVEGLGSVLALVCFYTDLPADASAPWREMSVLPACEACQACVKACPTGAVRPNRFLIDCDRCLSWYNETPTRDLPSFPQWLDPAWHVALYDCAVCQGICPQNRGRVTVADSPLAFDEDETEALLAEAPLTEALRAKLRALGMDAYHHAIARNLRALLEREADA